MAEPGRRQVDSAVWGEASRCWHAAERTRDGLWRRSSDLYWTGLPPLMQHLLSGGPPAGYEELNPKML